MGRNDQGLAQSRSRYQVVPRTLCFITDKNKVLLLHGAPHKRIWAGLYNGVGGHIEPGEDVYTATLREVKEETGLDVSNVRLRGIVHADVGDPNVGILFFVFTATAANQQIVPSDEGALEWLPVSNLPFAETVEDLRVLLPKLLAMGPTDLPFFASYAYDADDQLVISFATREQTL